jgi:hypothetical protein
MPTLRVHSVVISVDGYGAGPNQDLANPLGVGVALHGWALATRSFRRMFGQGGGTTGSLTALSDRVRLGAGGVFNAG